MLARFDYCLIILEVLVGEVEAVSIGNQIGQMGMQLFKDRIRQIELLFLQTNHANANYAVLPERIWCLKLQIFGRRALNGAGDNWDQQWRQIIAMTIESNALLATSDKSLTRWRLLDLGKKSNCTNGASPSEYA
jgi:hypothetical protein